MITREILAKQWPHALPTYVDGFLATQADAFAKGEITTKNRLAHFMGQITVESGGGKRLEENLVYTHAERLVAVWPSRFHSVEAAKNYVNAPRALANFVYAGRNGNRLVTDDGWTYRGRGYIQLTGRDNYIEVGVLLGLDLVNQPDLASDPMHALACAAMYWKRARCNEAADTLSSINVTRRVKGSTQELHDRVIATEAWKDALGVV